MKRLMILMMLAVSAPKALAVDSSCGRLERCRLYYEQLYCLKYGGASPANLTDEQRAIGFFHTAMEKKNCTLPSEDLDRRERCDAAKAVTFSEGEAQDCAALMEAER